MNPHNQSLEYASALTEPAPDALSAPLKARRSARRYSLKPKGKLVA